MLNFLNPSLNRLLILLFLVNLTILYIAYVSMDSLSFIKWDVIHYLNIKNNGYRFEPCAHVNVAFFPLFPYLVKFLNLNILGICLFNLTIFYVGLITLIKAIPLSPYSIIAFCLFPTSFFFYIPYTEALFFLSSAIMLWGIQQKNNKYLYIGTFLTGLCRPVISIFIPAFLIIIIWKILDKQHRNEYMKYVYSILISFASLLIVSYIQFVQTDTWFAMFKAQTCWDHFFQIKPFFGTSWGSTFIQRWDNIAAALGFSCLSLISLKFFSQYFNNLKSYFNNFITSDVEKLSFLYIAGISCSIWLFQSNWHSLNRYIWCSPFALILLNTFQKSPKKIAILSCIIFFVWLIPVGGSQHIQVFLQLFGIALYIFALFYFSNTPISKMKIIPIILITLIIVISIFYQWKFFYLFLNNQWVA